MLNPLANDMIRMLLLMEASQALQRHLSLKINNEEVSSKGFIYPFVVCLWIPKCT